MPWCKTCLVEKPRHEFPPSGRLCWLCAKIRNLKQKVRRPSFCPGDPVHRLLADRLRQRLSKAMRRGTKSGSAVYDLGCPIEAFQQHIERQFQNGMSWENYGAWHLDHIKPLISFDLSDRKQFLEAANYRNYQPLWARENILKGSKIIA